MLHKIISRTLPYFPPKLIWQFSKNYIAGETTQNAINASKALNLENIMVTLDILGEFIKTMSQAAKNRDEYLAGAFLPTAHQIAFSFFLGGFFGFTPFLGQYFSSTHR